nr:hypothetical protein PJ912_08820 [Pectobacterium colocasium]
MLQLKVNNKPTKFPVSTQHSVGNIGESKKGAGRENPKKNKVNYFISISYKTTAVCVAPIMIIGICYAKSFIKSAKL